MAQRVTIQFDLDNDVKQNEFKDWVKSCPFSPDGGQQLKWENIPDPQAEEAKEETAEAETEQPE